jgi:hypothetical protein
MKPGDVLQRFWGTITVLEICGATARIRCTTRSGAWYDTNAHVWELR